MGGSHLGRVVGRDSPGWGGVGRSSLCGLVCVCGTPLPWTELSGCTLLGRVYTGRDSLGGAPLGGVVWAGLACPGQSYLGVLSWVECTRGATLWAGLPWAGWCGRGSPGRGSPGRGGVGGARLPCTELSGCTHLGGVYPARAAVMEPMTLPPRPAPGLEVRCSGA